MPACVSELPHLLSLVGGALALNLAYLNLERFRYAKAILDSAKEVMDEVERNENFDFSGTGSYKQLKALVKFSDGRGGNGTQELDWGLRITRYLYVLIFLRPPTDRIVCISSVVASTTALTLGSGHPIGSLAWTCGLFGAEHIYLSYWILVLGVVSPMIFLALGIYIQQTSRRLAARIRGDLGKVMQREARDATVHGQEHRSTKHR